MHVALAIPTHNGTVTTETLQGALVATRQHELQVITHCSSLLAHGFNQLWAHAIISGVDWFAMMHADIAPPPLWVDLLIERAELAGADILAANVPIKAPPESDQAGQTSTAWLPHPGDPTEPKPLTIADLARLPETFDADDVTALIGRPGLLGCNTGLWVARLAGDWPKRCDFQINSAIDWTTDPPTCRVLSEDWRFAKAAAAAGARLCATTIPLAHLGPHRWTIGPEHAARPDLEPAAMGAAAD